MSVGGMCCPPQVMNNIEQQRKEAAWFHEQTCFDLCDKALANLGVNKDTTSIFPVRSEFTCDDTATSDIKGIGFSIAIGDSHVFASVKHLRE